MGWVCVAVMIVGFALNYALRPEPPKSISPKPGKIDGQFSEDGASIGVVFGTVEVKDINTPWFGDRRTYEKKTDGQVTGFQYEVGMEMVICHGRVDMIKAALMDGKVIVEGEFTGSENSGRTIVAFNPKTAIRGGGGGWTGPEGPSGVLRLSCGRFSTGQNTGVASYVAEQNGFNGGIGPANFGLAMATLEKTIVGDSPYLRPWSFRVKRIHWRDRDVVQWYDEKAEISVGRNREDVWSYLVQDPEDTAAYNDPNYDDSTWATGPGGFGNAPVGTTGYKTPVVKTRVIGVTPITAGTKLWLRTDLGPLNQEVLGIQCWHDDSARVWFNGVEIPLTGLEDPTGVDDEYPQFNSYGFIPAAEININGPNVVAYKVRDSFLATGSTPLGNNQYIYAGCQIGSDNFVAPISSTQSVSGNVIGMNAIHIIREVLTNKVWGRLRYNEEDINDENFRACADTIYDEKLGISIEWNKGDSKDFINEILKHISGVLYIDPETGTFMIRLIRADYNPETLLTLDESSIENFDSISRRATGELINEVTVAYTNSISGDVATAVAKDPGLMRTQGSVIRTRVEYPGLCTYYDASRAALRNLRVFGTPLLSCTISAARKASSLTAGQPFKIDHEDLADYPVVMRVVSVEYGDARSTRVKIEAVEDEFSSPHYTISTPAGIRPTIGVLAPLPFNTKYHTGTLYDERDNGTVDGVYKPPGEEGLFDGWVETSPGVLEYPYDGPIDSSYFDDLDSGSDDHSGVSPMLGKSFLAFKNGSVNVEAKYGGVWILDDVGGHWVDWDIPETKHYVVTKPRMHRDPRFDALDFKVGATFKVIGGTIYGGGWLTLVTVNALLWSTPLYWNFTPESEGFTWNTPNYLLPTSEIVRHTVSTEVLIASLPVSVADGNFAFGPLFYTQAAQPFLSELPAGPYRGVAQVSISGGDVGATTRVLFALTMVPVGWEGYPGYPDLIPFITLSSEPLVEGDSVVSFQEILNNSVLCNLTDLLYLSVFIATDSVDPVLVTLTYNSLEHGTYVVVPFIPGKAPEPHIPQWYGGSIDPSDDIGVDGDYYLNDETGDVFEKENGTWA